MKDSISQNVLFDFFDGKASSIQRRLIEEWLGSGKNVTFFYQCLDEWERQHPQYRPDIDTALTSYLALLNDTPVSQPTARQFQMPIGRRSWFTPLWLAASLVLLSSVGGFLFRKALFYRTYETGNAQTRQVTLADGTRITLNANSSLSVPYWNMDPSVRAVHLSGEGEFSVIHTTDHKRFRVETDDDFEVDVLGTEFVVYARDRGRKVVLNRGKVELTYQAGKRLTMKPGEVATLNDQSDQLKLSLTPQPERFSAWKKHQFYFDQTPLSEVALVLHEQFGLDIIIQDTALANRRLAGYFLARNPQEIIDVLSPLLNVSFEKRGNTVIIRSN